MILSVEITEKSFGNKQLLQNVKFSIDEGEKVGLIGRNGIGKSTLFGILLGRDQDFSGEVIFRKGSVIASTQQEYSGVGEQTVLDFILNDLPEYARLSKLLRELPEKMGENMVLIEKYTDALNRFQEKNFHFIEDKIKAELRDFGLSGFEDCQMKTLSGGQKRLVDTIKIIHSKADLALVDEPTNFMDSYAKNRFLNWMKNSNEAVLVITHDRDVLSKVDRIIEIRDGKTYIFKGNYDDYLRANMFSTTNQIQDFESIQRRIANLKDKVREYQRMKEKARDPSTIQRFKRLENKSREELTDLELIEKPSFWIDQENVENLDFKVAKSYQKFKAKNVKISIKNEETRSVRSLVWAENLALGYGLLEDALENKNGAKILFENVNFILKVGGILEIFGRNGVGKTSLIKTIFGAENEKAEIYDGKIFLDEAARVGIYSQEISSDFFEMNLKDAIEKIYLDQNISITEEKIYRILHQYLFSTEDFETPISELSGGQKARFQLIRMLSNEPQILILDEPTSHLDLPSIEELERALKNYSGAIIFVSHDDYFRKAMKSTKRDFQTVEIRGN
ncbi:ABC-F family ATP-binding cassette domain-containing protein [Candidatus Saccharibacteria bacterium]|nr:ABC-F family ATP-binding cassette domain-containing protein [Candidatus Saccharibacteria bacterium]